MALESLGTSKPAEPAKAGAAPPASEGSAAPPAATRPEWVPEAHWDPESNNLKLDSFGEHYAELANFKKAQDERAAAIPTKPEDVKFALPADVQLPEGVKLDENNPMLAQARKIVVDKKIDPAIANEFYGLYVKQQIAEHDAIKARVGQEMQKLGAGATERINAIRTFVTGVAGETGADAIMKNLFTVAQVDALEKIMRKASTQGASAPPGGAAATKPPPPKTLSERLFPNSAKKAG